MKITRSIIFVLILNSLVLSQIQESNYGKWLTSSGELKVLVVFAKFKDDTSSHQFWPADSYPSETNNFIDADMQKGSTHFLNLTNYYNQMSFGNFKVIGRAIGVETPYPMSHYIYGNAKRPERWVANKDILNVVDDSIDYREFDNWKYIDDYQHIYEPDGIIDMVIVIWRGLVFSDKLNGEMSLGYGAEFWVESHQKRIRMCHGGGQGSGINGSGLTVQYCRARRGAHRGGHQGAALPPRPMHRFLVSAAHKSSGKTTLSVGLAAALRRRGLSVQAFKKGPDYIDPLWLGLASGRACRNLDFYVASREDALAAFARHGASADVCVIRGHPAGTAFDKWNRLSAFKSRVLVLGTGSRVERLAEYAKRNPNHEVVGYVSLKPSQHFVPSAQVLAVGQGESLLSLAQRHAVDNPLGLQASLHDLELRLQSKYLAFIRNGRPDGRAVLLQCAPAVCSWRHIFDGRLSFRSRVGSRLFAGSGSRKS